MNATLEGVAHGLTQGITALESTGVAAHSISLIGGGSRSAYWAQLIADLSGKTMLRRTDAEVGPSLGAARLAWMAIDQASEQVVHAQCSGDKAERHARFAQLYQRLEPSFGAPTEAPVHRASND